MNWLVTPCWLALAAIHASPAAVLVSPGLTDTLYGVPSTGAAGVVVIHRGALFLAVAVVASYAAFTPSARKAATLLVGISVISFLLIYLAAGAFGGPLRLIALVDALALLPLACVVYSAWRISDAGAAGNKGPAGG